MTCRTCGKDGCQSHLPKSRVMTFDKAVRVLRANAHTVPAPIREAVGVVVKDAEWELMLAHSQGMGRILDAFEEGV